MNTRHSLYILLLLAGMLMSGRTEAQRLTAMRDSVAGSYDFWLYEPGRTSTDSSEVQRFESKERFESEGNVRLPLYIFLHGASLSGNDLQKVRKYGTINAIERGRRPEAYVLAPQTNEGWKPRKVWQLVEWLEERYPIDTNRIYVLGMSMGGYGTIDLAATYPDRIAAAMAMCGGNTVRDLSGLSRLPLWIIHGTADKAVPVSKSDKVVAAIKSTGDNSRLLYTKLPGQNHAYPARIFYMDEAYDWLGSHSLLDSGRVANRDYTINVQKMSTVYGNLGRKGGVEIVDKTIASTKTVAPTDSLPADSTTAATDSVAQKSAKTQTPAVYVVKKGDTLYSIARRYGTTVSAICKKNGIRENGILSLGQKLKL